MSLSFYRSSLAAIAFVLLGLGGTAFGCSCFDPGPPCHAYWNADVIFVGTPIRVSMIQRRWQGHQMPYLQYHFRVSDGLKDIQGKYVDVITISQGSACGYHFVLGTKYIVYGGRESGSALVGTGLCTRTRPFLEAKEDVEFARSVSQLPPGAEIGGSAHRYSVNLESDRWDEVGPIVDAKVSAVSGQRVLETRTGTDGTYRFSGLSPGHYSVSIEMPPDLSPQRLQEVDVHDRGCAHIDYSAVLDGRIAGKIVDVSGKSGGIQTIDLLPRSWEKKLRARWAISDENGNFEFKDLPPGKYVLAVNLDDAPDTDQPYQTTYYPTATNLDSAQILTIGAGEKRNGIEFRLPSPLVERTITGKVVWPDGRPAVKSTVELTDMATGRSAKWGVKVDGQGNFSLSAYDGVHYQIQAQVPADPNWDPESGKGVELLVSNEVTLTPSALTIPVTLIINVKGDGSVRTQITVRAASPAIKSRLRRATKRAPKN
jgi:hypothetical protein